MRTRAFPMARETGLFRTGGQASTGFQNEGAPRLRMARVSRAEHMGSVVFKTGLIAGSARPIWRTPTDRQTFICFHDFFLGFYLTKKEDYVITPGPTVRQTDFVPGGGVRPADKKNTPAPGRNGRNPCSDFT